MARCWCYLDPLSPYQLRKNVVRVVTVNVLWLFLTVPWVGLQFVIVAFPDHAQLLYGPPLTKLSGSAHVYARGSLM